MRWSVYYVVRDYLHPEGELIEPLGYVNADNYGRAGLKAFKRWPERMDRNRVNHGFSFQLYSLDHLPLGKKAKR